MPETVSKNYNQAVLDIEAALYKLNPGQIECASPRWQERKSALTRASILESTITCLIEFGYRQTSTKVVADRANISRGAVLHHYATKSELIAAAIDYLNFKRLTVYYDEIKKLSDAERVQQGKGIETWWTLLKQPEYDAFFELCVASRTDADLRKILNVKAKTHDEFLLDTLPKVFPEWAGKPRERLRLAHDVVVSALSGLRLNSAVIDDKERRFGVRQVVFDAVRRLRDDV